jgi:hypothetical protein
MSWLPWWPLRTGDDDVVHQSPPPDIYASVGEMPANDYQTEVKKYNEGRWRKGMMQSVFPATIFGAVFGTGWGVFQSRRATVRYVSRPRVIMTHMGSVTAISLTTAAIHHFLVVSNHYQQSIYQPLVSGMAGGVVFSLTYTGNANIVAGAVVGFVYTVLCRCVEWYQERALINFLTVQQQIQTPIHRVAPELQPMYRAFLWDHRPIEDTDALRRRALLLEREANDTRLDSQAYLSAVHRAVSSVDFPEWFPLRPPRPLDEQQALLDQRQKDDMTQRRRDAIAKEGGDDILFSRPLRSAATRARVPD